MADTFFFAMLLWAGHILSRRILTKQEGAKKFLIGHCVANVAVRSAVALKATIAIMLLSKKTQSRRITTRARCGSSQISMK